MKLTSSFIVLVVLIASGFCQEQPSTTETTPASTQSDSTTMGSTTTLSTSQKPDTTTDSPSTTTSSSTTLPTTTAVTTSEKPTTTSFPETTTSTQSTTISPATSTKAPEPPAPVEVSCNITEGNTTCIRAALKVRFEVQFGEYTDYVLLSPNATVKGSCSSSDGTQELFFNDSEDSGYTLQLFFGKDSNDAFVKNITFFYNLTRGSDTVSNVTKLYSAKIGNSYMCDSTSDVTFMNVTMKVFEIHVQSFGVPGNKDFGTIQECEADKQVNDMVPIAVGIALLVLVVIVLIAYFVGRRRSRQKGYQSV